MLQNVINQFSRTGMDPAVSFYGNVHVGKDLSLSRLRSLHHAVSLCRRFSCHVNHIPSLDKGPEACCVHSTRLCWVPGMNQLPVHGHGKTIKPWYSVPQEQLQGQCTFP